MDDAIRAIGSRSTNAQLMADCAKLGYLNGRVLDLTYGLGRFWTEFRPDDLTTNDWDESRGADHQWDFTSVPLPSGSFDSVVLDPPYKLNGTGGSHPSDEAYGVADPYMSINDRHMLMKLGLREAIRLARTGGFVLAKCQDQVSSGQVQWQTLLLNACAAAGVADGAWGKLVDMLHVQSYRSQPARRRQLHARRDYSTLLVFSVRA